MHDVYISSHVLLGHGRITVSSFWTWKPNLPCERCAIDHSREPSLVSYVMGTMYNKEGGEGRGWQSHVQGPI